MIKQIRSSTLQVRQVSRPPDIRDVYNQILKKFDKQSVKMKMLQTSPKIAFDDIMLSNKANRTLPKLEIQNKNTSNKRKFYSNKLIVNESVYINERKETTFQQISNFKKLSVPDPITAKEKCVLAQRNKRIMNLYKRVEKDRDKINSPAKISFVKNNQLSPKKSQTIENEYECEQEVNQQMRIRPSEKKMISILRQAKQRRNKLQFPKMKQRRSRSHLIIQTIVTQDPKQAIQCKKVEGRQVKKKQNKQYKKQQSQLVEEVKQKLKERNISLRKIQAKPFIQIRKKKYNWKAQPLSLGKIKKQQFHSLIRAYLKINNIIQPPSGYYRAFVGQGNNCTLIKKLIKDRGYWTIVQSLDDDPHFVWTQLKSSRFTDNCIKPDKNIDLIGKQRTIQFAKTIQQLQQDEELKFFIQQKRNDFMITCQKLLDTTIFLKLINSIKQKIKNSQNINSFTNLRVHVFQFLNQLKYETRGPYKAGELKLHNHIDGAGAIGDKKGLLHYFTKYAELFNQDISQLIPATIHLNPNYGSQGNVENIFEQIDKGPWILKPGQVTNRGNGITIHITKQSLINQISKKKKHKSGENYTYIIQKYVFPLLYFDRKFDIRVWVLWNGRQVWWYQQGYIRTSSKQFTLRNTNKFIHLTNDAIQSQCQDYEKYEPGNKLSYNEFQKYLQNHYGYKFFNQNIIAEMKAITKKYLELPTLFLTNNQSSIHFNYLGWISQLTTHLNPGLSNVTPTQVWRSAVLCQPDLFPICLTMQWPQLWIHISLLLRKRSPNNLFYGIMKGLNLNFSMMAVKMWK